MKSLLCGCSFAVSTAMVSATPVLNAQNPLGFFTNVASALLFDNSQQWLTENPSNFVATFNVTNAFGITNIPVLVGNRFVYTPAVHRLLQLAANVYEATSTNSYPAVFRPLFSRDANGFGTNFFVSGFTNVASVTGLDDGQLSTPMNVAALAETNIPVINLPVNVYGIPWIIGARKGLPNFNEFAMESAFQLTRKLQVTRQSTNDTFIANPSSYSFNQMFILSLSNQFGVECWNSYTNDFADPVAIFVTDNQAVTLTNDEGFSTNIGTMVSRSLQIPNESSSNWPGYNPQGAGAALLLTPASFQIPLNTSAGIAPLSIYRFDMGGSPYLTTNLTLPFETNVNFNGNLYPQPHWWLTTSNDLRVIIMDTAVSPYRIIDYVQLNGPKSSRDLASEIISNYDIPPGPGKNDLWDTNLQNGIPIGLTSQINVSLGNYGLFYTGGMTQTEIENEIDGFRAFFGFGVLYPNNPGEPQAVAAALMTNSIQAPYTPIATVVQHFSWQANDPLVHYLASDLNWAGATVLNRTTDNLTNENLGYLNRNYMPWGGNLSGQNSYNLALKDPLVWRSDDWNFPTNESLSGAWLGRVHRGTPWQTVYLKASDILRQTQVIGGVTNYIGTSTWITWTGDTDVPDAIAMAPVQDRHLASLLAYLMNTNDLPSLFSVNAPAPNGWPGLLNGLTALTNTASDGQIAAGGMPQFAPLVISSNSPQVSFIVNAIRSAQSSQPNHFFNEVGDILSIPQLTEQSPFLHWNDTLQQQKGISDEAYEILPSQLLPLLRADSISSVVSTNGQVIAQFTGYDDHAYAIETSSNLLDWTSVSTNFCQNGVFNFTNTISANTSSQFYRSRLVQ